MSADMVGEALVPYYRQILPILNIFKNVNSELQTFKWLECEYWDRWCVSVTRLQSSRQLVPLCYKSFLCSYCHCVSEVTNKHVFTRLWKAVIDIDMYPSTLCCCCGLYQGIPQSCSVLENTTLKFYPCFRFAGNLASCIQNASCFLPFLFSAAAYGPVPGNRFSFSFLHLKIHWTDFVLSAVRQAALCRDVEENTLSLLPLKAPTWVDLGGD